MIQSTFVKQQKIIFWIIGLSLFILLMANLMGWLYLQRIKSFFISDLKFRLENIAEISSKLIDANDIIYLIPGELSDPQMIFYQNLLFDIKENNHLQDIYILSPALETLVGVTPDISTGPLQPTFERGLINRALNGETATGELQILGDHKFLTSVTPIIDTNNMVSGLLIVEAPAEFFDMLNQFDQGVLVFSFLNSILILSVAFLLFRSIKRVFQLQNLIKNQEQLVKMGEMAASVAHELRNPLGIIHGANTLIQKKYASDKDEIFTYIPEELKRLNKLIEDFLAFSRTRSFTIQTVNIKELLTKITIALSEHSKIRINLNIENDFPEISTDIDTLEQILLNILNNSIQVSPDNGQISIKCDVVGKNIKIQISDNGPGISPEIMDRIFDPFFTTKEEGSGLGLAISSRLIEQLEGKISVQSITGKGTTVTIVLPAHK
jgi:signal transduction histidine kinase